MCTQQHLVENERCLVLRGEANADAVVIENTLVGLLDGEDVGNGFSLFERDGASVDRPTVHQNLESLRVGLFNHKEVVGKV